MKIKEVEQRTGVGRSNIQYYEKEGLLTRIMNVIGTLHSKSGPAKGALYGQ